MIRIHIAAIYFLTVSASLAQTCNCYYSTDCCSGVGGTCSGYGSCSASGKNDGTCGVCSAGRTRLHENPTAITSALDSYFKAFLVPIKEGGGRPDQKLADAAQAVPLSEAGHALVETAVWVSLDAVMGWDFMYPTVTQRQTGYLGNIREVHGVTSASALVDAVRQGLTEAVMRSDKAKIVPPLRAFWVEHPDYKPQHTGRCYPHGHDEVTDSKTSIDCQTEAIEQMAIRLISASSSDKPSNGTGGGQ